MPCSCATAKCSIAPMSAVMHKASMAKALGAQVCQQASGLGLELLGLVAGISGVYLLGQLVNVPTIGPTLAIMIGLGVGVDYALFMVSRHRQHLGAGLDYHEAAARATILQLRGIDSMQEFIARQRQAISSPDQAPITVRSGRWVKPAE